MILVVAIVIDYFVIEVILFMIFFYRLLDYKIAVLGVSYHLIIIFLLCFITWVWFFALLFFDYRICLPSVLVFLSALSYDWTASVFLFIIQKSH
jgi:hypothetical protein